MENTEIIMNKLKAIYDAVFHEEMIERSKREYD